MECFFIPSLIMKQMTQHFVSKHFLFKSFIRLLLCSFALMFNHIASASEHPNIHQQIKLLDQKTSKLANRFYQQLSFVSNDSVKTITTSEQLNDLFVSDPRSNHGLSLVITIHANLAFIREHLDPNSTPKVLKALLDNNDITTALSLFKLIKNNADDLLIAKASIQLADYYNDRRQWQNTLNILDFDFEELAELDASQASMAKGLALQNLKKHRQSIKEYNKVYANTPFHTSAQTNIAIAHLRQDWWTDAHIIIKQLLKPESKISAEFRDRLNLMLGYSFFNKEYYRESREAFRDISLESQYTNRAIMGLVLAAIAQQDYSGALKTLTLLNQKNGNELVIEESYLLLPHLHQKLQQFNKANLAYQKSIDYYEQRIAQLGLITPAEIVNNFNAIANRRQNTIQLAETKLELTTLYPEYFEKNIALLNQMKNNSLDPSISTKLDLLLNEYQETFELAAHQLVARRVNALSSYLSQSKFGLARLYDGADD